MASTVILASGGINSTVAAARAKQEGDIHLLHIDYGQKPADPQRAAVRMIADSLGGDFTSLELPHVNAIATLKKQTGAGTNREQNLRQQTLESVSQIPSLITVMIGVATQLAHRVGAGAIHVGTSELADEIENQTAPGKGTPDHRRDMFYLHNLLLEQLQKTKTPIKLDAPLIDQSRGDIIKLGERYKAPLDLTFSCHNGREARCGSCPSCVARTKAFKEAEIADPADVVTAS